MEHLCRKYRPRTLDDILGQPDVVRALKLFVAEPYPSAFLFHGESGVGKTAAALALAHDLGCDLDAVIPELGGVFEIASGYQNGQSVKEAIAALRYRPLQGSGWRALIVNECDRMTEQAETVWLDALEHIHAMSVVVFTTNRAERLSARFRSRCDCYAFTSSTEELAPHIRAFAVRVWREAGLKGKPPGLEMIGMPTLEGEDSMHANFRLALTQLGRIIAEATIGKGQRLKEAVAQVAADGVIIASGQTEARCEFCRKKFDVPAGARKARCPHCKKANELEWAA